MSVARNCTIPGLLFNAKYGFLDGRLRGYIDDLLSETDYSILAECPTLDDVVSYLVCIGFWKFHGTRYWTFALNLEYTWTKQAIEIWRLTCTPVRTHWAMLELLRVWVQLSSFVGRTAMQLQQLQLEWNGKPSLPGTRTFIDFFELLDLWIHDW